jgi:hypothetical protein
VSSRSEVEVLWGDRERFAEPALREVDNGQLAVNILESGEVAFAVGDAIEVVVAGDNG